jgi:hypothetical protein
MTYSACVKTIRTSVCTILTAASIATHTGLKLRFVYRPTSAVAVFMSPLDAALVLHRSSRMREPMLAMLQVGFPKPFAATIGITFTLVGVRMILE